MSTAIAAAANPVMRASPPYEYWSGPVSPSTSENASSAARPLSSTSRCFMIDIGWGLPGQPEHDVDHGLAPAGGAEQSAGDLPPQRPPGRSGELLERLVLHQSAEQPAAAGLLLLMLLARRRLGRRVLV